jgi:hypothetical protein
VYCVLTQDLVLRTRMLPGHVTTLPMVEWRDPVDEDIERNLESVSRITGTSANGNVTALKVYEVSIYF